MSRRGRTARAATLAAGLVTLVLGTRTAGAQVVAGQRDDFENGLTQGWQVGDPSHPAPPVNVATGGPLGANDNFLRLTSFGSGDAGSHLSTTNTTRWVGDYLAAGIGGIGMDLINLGQTTVSLRLLFADPTPVGPPSNIAWSTDAFVLPVGSGWVHAFFPILPGSLTVPVGTYAAALSAPTELRLFHNPASFFLGPPNSSPPIAAQIGVDNITAVAVVPEPATLGLLAGGLAVLGVAVRRRA